MSVLKFKEKIKEFAIRDAKNENGESLLDLALKAENEALENYNHWKNSITAKNTEINKLKEQLNNLKENYTDNPESIEKNTAKIKNIEIKLKDLATEYRLLDAGKQKAKSDWMDAISNREKVEKEIKFVVKEFEAMQTNLRVAEKRQESARSEANRILLAAENEIIARKNDIDFADARLVQLRGYVK